MIDDIYLFDPKVHMYLSDDDRLNLENFERYVKMPWFKEV
jgi:hypothetical protein